MLSMARLSSSALVSRCSLWPLQAINYSVSGTVEVRRSRFAKASLTRLPVFGELCMSEWRMASNFFLLPYLCQREEANVVFRRVIACSACVEYCDSFLGYAHLDEVFPSKPLRVLVLPPRAKQGLNSKSPTSRLLHVHEATIFHRLLSPGRQVTSHPRVSAALSRKVEPRAAGAFSFPDARYPESRFFDVAATTTSAFQSCTHIEQNSLTTSTRAAIEHAHNTAPRGLYLPSWT